MDFEPLGPDTQIFDGDWLACDRITGNAGVVHQPDQPSVSTILLFCHGHMVNHYTGVLDAAPDVEIAISVPIGKMVILARQVLAHVATRN